MLTHFFILHLFPEDLLCAGLHGFHREGVDLESPLCLFVLECHINRIIPSILFWTFFFWLFRAAPTACESSQARGQIGARAAVLRHSHSHVGSKPCLWPTPQLRAMPDPYPLSKARDWTCILMILVGFINRWATKETPGIVFLMVSVAHCFFRLCGIPLYVPVNHSLLTHQLVDGCLGCF